MAVIQDASCVSPCCDDRKFMVSLRVRDNSCSGWLVNVNMFGYSENDLPKVHSIGDIIHLKAAQMQV